jgi:hypothetical protein
MRGKGVEHGGCGKARNQKAVNARKNVGDKIGSRDLALDHRLDAFACLRVIFLCPFQNGGVRKNVASCKAAQMFASG